MHQHLILLSLYSLKRTEISTNKSLSVCRASAFNTFVTTSAMVIPVTVCLFVVHQHGVFDLQVIIFSDGALGDDHEHDDDHGADHANDD